MFDSRIVSSMFAALCGRVHNADVRSSKSSDDEGRPRRLIPPYYTPGNNYDSLLHDEYIRQQERHGRKYNNDEYIRPQETPGRKNYNMVAGYSYTNGDSQQFFKQYLPEAASSFQTPTYLKYVTDNSPKPSAPIPPPIPKFKPIQPAGPTDYYLTTPASQPNNQYVVVNDNGQYYYQPSHNVQPQQVYKYLHVPSTPAPAPTLLYNLVSTAQPQQYQDQVHYQAQYPTSANQAQYQENNQVQYQENTQQAQYQQSSEEQNYQDSRDQPQYQDANQQYQNNPETYQQYVLDSNKQPDDHPERQYLPLQDKLSPIQYQAQTQYQSPVAGQYQAETYPTTNEPHRFAPTKQPTQDVKSNVPRLPSTVTSVTIQKSQELPLKNNYSENDDSQREQSLQYPTKPTKLQKVRPTPTQNTESYYPYEHLQPFVENMKYANQQSKPSPFHHAQSPVTTAQPYYVSSTTPLYPSTPFVSSATVTPKKQNVKIISDNDEELGGKLPFDFLKNFQLGKDQNYEIPLTSFTGPAKENSFSTTEKPQSSYTKASTSFYDPYLKLIKSSSNKINPTHSYKTQRPRPEEKAPVTTEQSILPPHEEQKYRENIGALTQILKGHQINKALPEKVTADNIDSSIDTLTTILKVLQKNPGGFPVPPAPATPVKPQHFPYTGSLDNSLTLKTHSQTYTDGSTPGKPGIDYPTYTEIPETQFNCKTQRYKGFFGDPETDCQVI